MPYVDLQQPVDFWEAGAANYFTSTFLDQLPAEALKTLADYHHSSADLPVQAELHLHHLAVQSPGFRPTAQHLPTAARHSSSTAPRVQPIRQTFRHSVPGHELPEMQWNATEKVRRM